MQRSYDSRQLRNHTPSFAPIGASDTREAPCRGQGLSFASVSARVEQAEDRTANRLKNDTDPNICSHKAMSGTPDCMANPVEWKECCVAPRNGAPHEYV